jgi:hypothetical protein
MTSRRDALLPGCQLSLLLAAPLAGETQQAGGGRSGSARVLFAMFQGGGNIPLIMPW